MSLQVTGREVPIGAMHCWIYIPAVVGNLVKPPLTVDPAGSRLVSGLLANANVSACDGRAVRIGSTNPKTIAAIFFCELNIVLLNEISIYFLVKVMGIKRSWKRSPSWR